MADCDLAPEVRARRKEAILEGLLSLLEATHRKRRRRRRAAAGASVLVLSACAGVLALRGGATTPVAHDDPSAAPGAHGSSRVQLVSTDPAAASRHAARAAESRVAIVGDTELLDALAAIDRHAGLVRTGGRAWLTGGEID